MGRMELNPTFILKTYAPGKYHSKSPPFPSGINISCYEIKECVVDLSYIKMIQQIMSKVVGFLLVIKRGN